MTDTAAATLVTGGSGFVGSAVCAALLAHTARRLVLPVRRQVDPAVCRAQIALALGALEGAPVDPLRVAARVDIVDLPPFDRLRELDARIAAAGVDEIAHCAGCVDYFDGRALQAANVEFTSSLLEAAKEWGLARFLFVSTAYASGYLEQPVPERLHADPPPAREPTEYTRSKRRAEWLVADSGLPFVIVRPAVLIGDSRTGRYWGKNYGLYQMWRAIEGLLCREYAPIWSTVAPPVPLNLVHLDAFQAAFAAIHRAVPHGSIVNLVGSADQSPTLRELCWLWAEVYWPEEIHTYACVDDVPLAALPMRQRRFLELADVNLRVACHPWRFETRHVDGLRAAGLRFTDATLSSVALAQRRYVEGSQRIRDHQQRYARPGRPPRLVEHGGARDGAR